MNLGLCWQEPVVSIHCHCFVFSPIIASFTHFPFQCHDSGSKRSCLFLVIKLSLFNLCLWKTKTCFFFWLEKAEISGTSSPVSSKLKVPRDFWGWAHRPIVNDSRRFLQFVSFVRSLVYFVNKHFLNILPCWTVKTRVKTTKLRSFSL